MPNNPNGVLPGSEFVALMMSSDGHTLFCCFLIRMGAKKLCSLVKVKNGRNQFKTDQKYPLKCCQVPWVDLIYRKNSKC
jgi:hypothetical protein